MAGPSSPIPRIFRPIINRSGIPVTTLEQCYQFDPSYGIPKSKQTHIQGIMGALWGNAMLDDLSAAIALSEIGYP